MIPKIVHYCWFGKGEYSPLMKECIKTWEEKLPDWKIMVWTESNSVLDNKFVEEAMKKKKYAFVADYIRCTALLEYGGVYLDTDMELLKDIGELLNCEFFAGYEDINKKWISCGVIGSIPNHIILREMKKYYGNTEFNIHPIPKILTNIIENLDIRNNDNINFYPYWYFYPYNPYDAEQKVKQLMAKNIRNDTYAIHHWNNSWKPTFFERLVNFIKKKVQ